MISSFSNTKLIDSRKQAVNFRGFNDETYGLKSKNAQNWCLHETFFFRNIESLEFVKDYVTKKFPMGTHIAGFGCSDGEEEYSLAMLLKAQNKDKKYKITGYDISPKVIKKAQNGPFQIGGGASERLISSDFSYQKSDRKYLRNLFWDSFEKMPEKFFDYREKVGDAAVLDYKINEEKDLKKLIQLKCFKELLQHSGRYYAENAYIPKPDIVDGVLDFKVGDFNKISQIIKPQDNTGVIIFKNAWYHILGSRDTFDANKLNLKGAASILKKVHDILPPTGLLVVGNLPEDHIYSEQKTHLVMQNNKRISVCDETLFHKILKENGFKPVFYEHIKDTFDGIDKSGVHLPSVWQKAAHSL